MADLNTIIKAVDALPRIDQRRLLAHLQEVVPLHATTSPLPLDTARRRFELLHKTLCDIVGIDTLDTPSRKRHIVWARHILSFQMRTEGYTTLEVARCIHRDHATVINSYHQVEAMLECPEAYREEMLVLLRMRDKIGGPAV